MMQDVRRKSPSHRPRWLLPVIALVLLACVLAALVITSLKKEEPVAVFRYEKAVLSARPASDVLSIRVTHPAGTGWCGTDQAGFTSGPRSRSAGTACSPTCAPRLGA